MTALRRSPLLLAVVLALVPALALAVALGPLRHRASPTAVAVPTPAPPVTPLPALIARDNTGIAGTRAFGRIDVTGYDNRDNVDISTYTLAATPPTMPVELPVWRLRGFLGADISALEARLGVAPTTPEFPGDKFEGRIDAGQAQIAAGSGNPTTLLTIAAQPRDGTSAVAAVAQLMAQLGLAPQSVDVTATPSDGDRTTIWQVTYRRRSIGGVPVGFGLFHDPVAEVDVSELGNVTRLTVSAPALDGGSRYPLRTWQDAWTDVSRGHWFDECCEVYTGAGPRTAAPFRADTVSLAYEQIGSATMRLVPMYVFTDSTRNLALAVPALRLDDLAEPGGFRLTQPGGAQ